MLHRSLVFAGVLAIFASPSPALRPPAALAETAPPATPSTTPSAMPSANPCDQSRAVPIAPGSIPLMAVAPDGTLYVMQPSQTILRFHPGAHGDAPPDAQFCLSYKATQKPIALAATRYAVFVGALGWVSVLPATASGTVTPIRTLGDPRVNPLDTMLFTNMGPYQLSVGRDGTIYVLSDKTCHCSAGGTADAIDIYPPGAHDNASPARSHFAPEYTSIQGGKPTKYSVYVDAMGLDGQSRLFLVSDKSLVVSRPGARAPFALEANLTIFANPQNRQLAFDDAGTAYIAQGSNILVVTGATGASAHATKLAGPKTRITDAESIATDASGKLYVLNCADADTSILVFPPVAYDNILPLYELHGSTIGLSCPVKRYA